MKTSPHAAVLGLAAMACAVVIAHAPAVAAPADVSQPAARGELILFSSDPPTEILPASRSIRSWRVRNAWGDVVLSAWGERARRGVIAPPAALGPGYYEADVRARGGDRTLAFAVLPDAARRSSEESAFGVMTHFAHGWEPDLIPLMARAGVRRVRDELYWDRVEERRGRYAVPQDWRGYLDGLETYGVDLLLVLSFANPLYDGGLTPHTAEGAAAFARYAEALLERHPGRFAEVEVWNEINGSFCEGPCEEDRAGVYAQLLETTFGAVKAAAPETVVAGGAAVLAPLGYYRELFEQGGLDNLDAVVIHPYGATFETIGPAVDGLNALMAEFGEPKPIWVTEYGLIVDGEAERRESAADLVRMLTAMRAAGVARIYWYLMRDYEPFVGMGLLRAPGSPLGRYAPAPALPAFAHLNAAIGGSAFVCRAELDPRTHVYRFDGDGAPVRVAWSLDGEGRLEVAAAGPVEVRDMFGAVTEEIAPGAARTVPLGAEPVFVVGDLAALGERRRDRVLADSVRDFSFAQGGRGWSYGLRGPEEGAWRDAVVGEDPYGPIWSFEGLRFAYLNASKQHPPPRGAVARAWTSDYAGRVRVEMTAESSGDGDGVEVALSRSGERLFAERLTPESRERGAFERRVRLREGDRLELAVRAGAGDAFDATGVRLTVIAEEPVRYEDGCR